MSRITTDFYRTVSIIAVLIIHAAGPFEYIFQKSHDYTSESFLAVFLGQLARFSVPVFIFLSGYGLAIGYSKKDLKADPEPGRWMSFFKRRATRIVIPFLFWTVLILFFTDRLNPDTETLAYFYRRGADYHFYFFHIIIQMYILFPVLYTLNRRFRSVALLILIMLVQMTFSSPVHILFQKLELARPSFYSAFFIYWIFYFYAGVYLASKDSAEKSQTQTASAGQNIVRPVAAFLLFLVVLAEYLYWSYRQSVPDYYNHFTRISVILYSAAFIALIRTTNLKITQMKQSALIQKAGAFSFAVYIFHTWILRGIVYLSDHFLPLPFIGIAMLLVLLSFGFAQLLDLLIPWNPARIVFGLPEIEKRK